MSETDKLTKGIEGMSLTAKGIDGIGLIPPEEYRLARPTRASAEKLEHLIRENNKKNAILFNNKRFHNHIHHVLVSDYFLGASPLQLTAVFEAATKILNPWPESQTTITDENWDKYLGNVEYEVEYINYFKDKIEEAKTDWKSVVRRFLVDEKNSLIIGVYGGLAHPLIHLGYAFEIDSSVIAAEALTLCAINYSDMNQLFKLDSTVSKTEDSLAILKEMERDSFFDVLYNNPRDNSLITPEFWNKLGYYASRLAIPANAKDALKDLLYISTIVFGATISENSTTCGYDFFLLHAITGCHSLAEIILGAANDSILPPQKCHKVLVQGLWNVICFSYVCQLRPRIDDSKIMEYEIKSQKEAWKEAVDLTLEGVDEHLPKAIRALLFAEMYTENKDGFYAKVALNFARSFSATPCYAGFDIAGRAFDIKRFI